METRTHPRRVNYVTANMLRTIAAGVASGIALAMTANYFKLKINLNFESLVQALVSLNTGMIIAVFVAIFHSTEKNIVNFKKFRKAAKQAYLILILNTAVVCGCAIFINNTDISAGTATITGQQVINITIAGIIIASSVRNLYLVCKLLSISFRDISPVN